MSTANHRPIRIILATSNGVGMGHLSRQVAIALALQRRAEPVIFSMSPVLPMVSELGLGGEYCPGYHGGVMPRHDWDRYLADRLVALVEETGARVVLFDGVVPYRGLLRARTALPHVAFVWVRRALWRSGANMRSLQTGRFFDLVIEPGDLASVTDRGATSARHDALQLPPVTLIEQIEQIDQLPRRDAAAKLGLDPDRPTALVTVRGRPSGRRGPAAAAIQALSSDPDWQIAVPRRPLAAGAAGGCRGAGLGPRPPLPAARGRRGRWLSGGASRPPARRVPARPVSRRVRHCRDRGRIQLRARGARRRPAITDGPDQRRRDRRPDRPGQLGGRSRARPLGGRG